jgi:hypothetical protein
MGKESRRKKYKKQWIRQQPDDVFARGPIRVERYGRFIRMRNIATPEQYAEAMKRAKDINKKILVELESELALLQSLIGKYDALELMHRATYMLLPLFIDHRSETDLIGEQSYFLPTVEYIQYLVARTVPAKEATAPTEEEWEVLWSQALRVVNLTQSHLMTRGMSTQHATEIDHLRFLIDSQRLGIRVNRYPLFRVDHLRSSLSPYERQITEVYGLGIGDIITGLDQIADYQQAGVLDRYAHLHAATVALMERLAKAGYDISQEASADEVVRLQAALASDDFQEQHEQANEAARLTLTPAIFDITDVTSLPKTFLSLLSVRPGESVLTTLTGPNHDDLSPLSPSLLHHKPFMEIDGRFYTFYHSGFEDNIADIIEADLFAKRPGEIGAMTLRRGERLESDAHDLLKVIIRPDFAFENVYYPNPDDPATLTELDLLTGVDDVLFVVESKAGAMDAAAKRGAPDSLAQALSDLIVEGQRQSERAERYIRSNDEVAFFDETGKREVHRVRHSNFRRLFRIVVTREELGWVGAKIAILSVLDPSLSTSAPWHVSIDDLRVIAHLFKDDEIRFAHYLESRLLAAGQPALNQADELEHVGLYNKMNYYHDLPVRGADHTSFAADYMRDIDYYFMDLSAGIDTPLPTQAMPTRIRQLVAALQSSALPHRFEGGSIVLAMSSEARDGVANALDTLDVGLLQGRQRSFRTSFNDIGFSISYAEGKNWEEELLRSAVQMDVSGTQRWLAIQLVPGKRYEVRSIEVITPGRFSVTELASARATHEKKAEEAIAVERPGRNDICPCGSGKKFKKCHGP